MSDDTTEASLPTEEMWRQWHIEVRVAFDDMTAVIEDQLRPPRERDLGPREALRLYRDARDKLTRLFAHADRCRAESRARRGAPTRVVPSSSEGSTLSEFR